MINTYIQMQLPSSLDAFKSVSGEIPRYFAGDPTAGTYVSGMFGMMMFGLVGASLAMYKQAYKQNKERVKGLLYAAALCTFVTGITEPIELSFMFVSPVLFVVHALFTGLSNVICNIFNIKIVGVGGSGLIDYILQFNKATHPILLIFEGIFMFFLYYLTFSFLIKKLNLKTPGREDITINTINKDINISEKSRRILQYIGGNNNIEEFENCITRLRIKLYDINKLDVKKLKEFGVIEVMKMSNNNVHLVIGLEVEKIANEIESILNDEKIVEGSKNDN
ncbi:MAG: PTS transporter subunit EIIC [Tissierellia bacterium]|nr:PTS transporter subunit EIIC [Tissierellia bacterium]